MPEQVIVIGGGGHAKVVIDCIEAAGDTVVGILDDSLLVGTKVLNIPVLGQIACYNEYIEYRFIIAIGNDETRSRIVNTLFGKVKWYTAVHPTAVVSRYACIGEGSVVLAKAVVNASAFVGNHCIINTAAVIEHDNVINDFVHVSPNASLGGIVKIGKRTHVGIGAVVKNNIEICDDCVIGAGAAVVKNITEAGTYVGVPARRLR